jgi:hypothetical protein
MSFIAKFTTRTTVISYTRAERTRISSSLLGLPAGQRTVKISEIFEPVARKD